MTGVLGDSLQQTPLTEIIRQLMPVHSQSQVEH
jgi:hypothetical protein